MASSSLQNYILHSKVYGILCIPKKEGKYPALLELPGAYNYPGKGNVEMAEKGMITFQIEIHGLSALLDESVYKDLWESGLHEYWTNNLQNKDLYYYKRVIMACIRSNDFLVSLPQFNGKNLAVSGLSQGGGLAIITASLDKRVKWVGSYFPALCYVGGYLQGEAGGWPPIFKRENAFKYNQDEALETIGYYDAINFARRLKIPGFYSWGYNDETCSVTSMFACYNSIKAPKTLFIKQETGHWLASIQIEKMNAWLTKHLLDH